MTPEQEAARVKQLLAAARALVAGDVGLVLAARNIERALRLLGPAAPKGFTIFEEFHKAIPLDIPLGTARLNWTIDLLLDLDERQMKVESSFRPGLLKACAELMAKYGHTLGDLRQYIEPGKK
jgi:hypothetical protein